MPNPQVSSFSDWRLGKLSFFVIPYKKNTIKFTFGQVKLLKKHKKSFEKLTSYDIINYLFVWDRRLSLVKS